MTFFFFCRLCCKQVTSVSNFIFILCIILFGIVYFSIEVCYLGLVYWILFPFFFWSPWSILYNRGVYPEDSFAKVKKYGLPLLLTQDEGVKTFISNLTSQLSGKIHFVDLNLDWRFNGLIFYIYTLNWNWSQSGWKLGNCKG